MKLVLLGPPGSGKGTLAEQIEKDFGFPQISTGDMLREEIAKKSKIGLFAQIVMAKGELVPDELIVKLVKKRIKQQDCKNGFVLDGFPRNIEQAQKLAKITSIDKVIYIDITLNEIKQRLRNRLICPNCKTTFNTELTSQKTCSTCGAHLIKRVDDAPEIIEKRFKIYLAQSAPLVDFYKDNLFKLQGKNLPQDTYAPIYKFLKEGK